MVATGLQRARITDWGSKGISDEALGDMQFLEDARNVRWSPHGLTKRHGWRWTAGFSLAQSHDYGMNVSTAGAGGAPLIPAAHHVMHLFRAPVWSYDLLGDTDIYGMTVGDFLYIGRPSRFHAIGLTIESAPAGYFNTNTTPWYVEYWDGTSWRRLNAAQMPSVRTQNFVVYGYHYENMKSLFTDGDQHINTVADQMGFRFSWVPPVDWSATQINSHDPTGFFIRIGISAGSLAATIGPGFTDDLYVVPTLTYVLQDRTSTNYRWGTFTQGNTRCIGLFSVARRASGAHSGSLSGIFIEVITETWAAGSRPTMKVTPGTHNAATGLFSALERSRKADNTGSPSIEGIFREGFCLALRGDSVNDPITKRQYVTAEGQYPMYWSPTGLTGALVEDNAVLNSIYSDDAISLLTELPKATYCMATSQNNIMLMHIDGEPNKVIWNQIALAETTGQSRIWPGTAYLYIPTKDKSGITGGKSFSGMDLVFTSGETWQLVFGGSDKKGIPFWTSQQRFSVGCVSNKTLCVAEGKLYFLGEGGFYRTDGNTVENVSDQKDGPTIIESLRRTNQARWKYACAEYWPEKGCIYLCLPTGNRNDQIWVFDVFKNAWFRDDGYEVAAICYFQDESDVGHIGFFDYDNRFFVSQEEKWDMFAEGTKAAFTAYAQSHDLFEHDPAYSAWKYSQVVGKQMGSHALTWEFTDDDGRAQVTRVLPMVDKAQNTWGDGRLWGDLSVYDDARTETLRINVGGTARTKKAKVSLTHVSGDMAISDLEHNYSVKGVR